MKNPYQDVIDWLDTGAGTKWSWDSYGGINSIIVNQDRNEAVLGFFTLKRTEECYWCRHPSPKYNTEAEAGHPDWLFYSQGIGNVDTEGPFQDYAEEAMHNADLWD